jgi:hypothetical protein
MKSGDRVIWLHSKEPSFATGWRLKRLPGVIERVCRASIRIRVRLGGREKVVNVVTENVLSEGEGYDWEIAD